MRRLALLLALVLVVAACGDDDTSADTTAAPATTAAPTTEAPADEDMSDEEMSDEEMSDEEMSDEEMSDEEMSDEDMSDDMSDGMSVEGAVFEITTVNFESPVLVITNVGTETGNLGGHWICQRPSYQELPAVDIEAGQSVAISLGGDVFPEGVTAVEGVFGIGGISAADGEVGLYSSNNFGSADAIVSYVEWGNSGHGRSATAVEAGLWNEGGFVSTSDSSAGIQQDVEFSMSSTGWSDF